jgi:hypothetical protein
MKNFPHTNGVQHPTSPSRFPQQQPLPNSYTNGQTPQVQTHSPQPPPQQNLTPTKRPNPSPSPPQSNQQDEVLALRKQLEESRVELDKVRQELESKSSLDEQLFMVRSRRSDSY